MPLTPMPTCAVDTDARACTHDRLEPMWDIDPVEETGNPGPYVFCRIAYRADEVPNLLDVTLDCLIEEMETDIRMYQDPEYTARYGALNACELLHLANSAHDLAKLKQIKQERGR